MKIDFEHFKLYKGIDKEAYDLFDARKVFADAIYTKGTGIAFHALAFKIYNSNSETEYSDEEFELMAVFSEQCMSPRFIDSINALKDESKTGIQQNNPV